MSLNPQYPCSGMIDEFDRAMDLLRTARLACHARVSPGLITDEDIGSIGYALTYALDILEPVRKGLNGGEANR